MTRPPRDDDPWAGSADGYGLADDAGYDAGYGDAYADDAGYGSGYGAGRPGAARPVRRSPVGGARGRGPAPVGRSRVLLGVAVSLLVLVGAVGVWVQRQVDPSGGPGELVSIEVPQGATSGDIGALLADQGVISSGFVWDWYLRVRGGGPFEAGVYELAANSSMGDVVAALEAGPKPPDEVSLTIVEGLTVAETLDRLADPDRGLGFDRATMQALLDSGQVRSAFQPVDQPSSEGILFPETYRIGADATPQSVLTLMVEQLDAVLRGLDVESAQERLNLTPYEILITASLIEEETKVPSERPMVARVIYNRLRQGIPLGIDATSRYEAEVVRGDRDKIDFSSSSPYNTRKVKGLPPTPIAAPGRASIEAALNPADGPWIYYVLEDSAGNHFFTESNQEFLAAKARCRDAGLGCG